MRAFPPFVVRLALVLVPFPAMATSPVATVEAGLESTRHITLTDALHLTRNMHPRLVAHQADLSAANYVRNASRARMLPVVAVGDMLNYSDASIGLTPAPAKQNESLLAAFPKEVGVNLFYAGIKQPLTGLLPLSYEYRSARAEVAAESDRLAYARATLETEVRTRFASLFRARALTDSAIGSERSLQDQAKRARAQLAAGSSMTSDVLRIEAALAGARQQRVTAESAAVVEHVGLLETLGLAEERDHIDFVSPEQFVDEGLLEPAALLRQTALSRRADLSAQVHAAESLRLQARGKLLELLPKIDVSGNYVNIFGRRTDREGTHVKGNVWVAGLSATWPLWTWGAQLDGHRAARARAQAARSRLEESRRLIGAEVAGRHASVTASDSGIELAHAQVAAAEEAYRVMLATLAANAATTTDLLAAEAAQTQARNALIEAKFSAIIARLALQHALGAQGYPPGPLAPSSSP